MQSQVREGGLAMTHMEETRIARELRQIEAMNASYTQLSDYLDQFIPVGRSLEDTTYVAALNIIKGMIFKDFPSVYVGADERFAYLLECVNSDDIPFYTQEEINDHLRIFKEQEQVAPVMVRNLCSYSRALELIREEAELKEMERQKAVDALAIVRANDLLQAKEAVQQLESVVKNYIPELEAEEERYVIATSIAHSIFKYADVVNDDITSIKEGGEEEEENIRALLKAQTAFEAYVSSVSKASIASAESSRADKELLQLKNMRTLAKKRENATLISSSITPLTKREKLFYDNLIKSRGVRSKINSINDVRDKKLAELNASDVSQRDKTRATAKIIARAAKKAEPVIHYVLYDSVMKDVCSETLKTIHTLYASFPPYSKEMDTQYTVLELDLVIPYADYFSVEYRKKATTLKAVARKAMGDAIVACIDISSIYPIGLEYVTRIFAESSLNKRKGKEDEGVLELINDYIKGEKSKVNTAEKALNKLIDEFTDIKNEETRELMKCEEDKKKYTSMIAEIEAQIPVLRDAGAQDQLRAIIRKRTAIENELEIVDGVRKDYGVLLKKKQEAIDAKAAHKAKLESKIHRLQTNVMNMKNPTSSSSSSFAQINKEVQKNMDEAIEIVKLQNSEYHKKVEQEVFEVFDEEDEGESASKRMCT